MIARGYLIFTLLAISVRPHPVPSDNTRNEDVKVMRCIMEVVASALSKPSTSPSSQECRDVLMGDERIASILRHQNLVQELQEVAAGGTDADSVKQGLDEDPLPRNSSEEEEENEETQRLDEKSAGVHNRVEEEEEEEETVHGEGPSSRKMLKEEEEEETVHGEGPSSRKMLKEEEEEETVHGEGPSSRKMLKEEEEEETVHGEGPSSRKMLKEEEEEETVHGEGPLSRKMLKEEKEETVHGEGPSSRKMLKEEKEETVHGEGPSSRKMLKEEEGIPGSNRKEAGHQQSQEALHSSNEEVSNRSPKGHVIKNPARGEEEEGSTSRRMEDSEMEPLSAMESELEKMAQRIHKLRRG